MKEVRKKGALMVISGILLISIILYMSFAWYTKMTSMGGMKFTVARWDFNASYQVDDFKVNVFEYTSLYHDLAAPGTKGTVPIELNIEESDTDVEYTISVDKSSMIKEFQDRIYFYYKGEDGELHEFVASGPQKSFLQGTIEKEELHQTVLIYWEWLYDFDEYLQRNEEDRYNVLQILRELDDNYEGNLTALIDYYEDAVSKDNTKNRLFKKAYSLPEDAKDRIRALYTTQLAINPDFSLKSIWNDYLVCPEAFQDSTNVALKTIVAYNTLKHYGDINSENLDRIYAYFAREQANQGTELPLLVNLDAEFNSGEGALTEADILTLKEWYTTKYLSNARFSIQNFMRDYNIYLHPELATATPTPTPAPTPTYNESDAEAYAILQKIDALDGENSSANLNALFENREEIFNNPLTKCPILFFREVGMDMTSNEGLGEALDNDKYGLGYLKEFVDNNRANDIFVSLANLYAICEKEDFLCTDANVIQVINDINDLYIQDENNPNLLFKYKDVALQAAPTPTATPEPTEVPDPLSSQEPSPTPTAEETIAPDAIFLGKYALTDEQAQLLIDCFTNIKAQRPLSTTYAEIVREYWNQYKTDEKKYEDFDTAAGMNNELYAKYMSATVSISGIETKPVPSPTPTT